MTPGYLNTIKAYFLTINPTGQSMCRLRSSDESRPLDPANDRHHQYQTRKREKKKKKEPWCQWKVKGGNGGRGSPIHHLSMRTILHLEDTGRPERSRFQIQLKNDGARNQDFNLVGTLHGVEQERNKRKFRKICARHTARRDFSRAY